MRQFDFGANWREYSKKALDANRVSQARAEFRLLMEKSRADLRGQSFLDIGFGQGLSLLAAASEGARVVGCDINPICARVLEANRVYFSEVVGEIPVVVGSILDMDVVEKLRAVSPEGRGYDVVHSWGVLHHTGDMRLAVEHAAGLVRPGGDFVLAIYNRHWSSVPWLIIKWLYVHSPDIVQRMMIAALSPVIYVAKWLVTGADPRRQARGMDFYFNVVDWVGGYPYEYGSETEVRALVEPLGFSCINVVSAEVPTGCNEFVFRRHR